ncbi:glycerophosphodiester phosphodiesterase [Pedobacter psychrodurus]|uniref:Glycerophosphodiester phosphodiesterase n=1 Tax=Pedobacter psychrodurus TaxID=2530456 RepID=A0A4R0Q0M2_9SPHI|nr:glycerophosphodiester phosphodiesterase [Pedobacter psychrodurus]TCD26147.1 glycerophosphodiester phosphodiesterase [Pedobacter psychrodurus]
MVKHLFVFLALILSGMFAKAQVKIHSHNDYTHQKPFFEAINNNVFSIEADVFVVGDSLMVAHSKKEIKAGNTLEQLYLKQIKALSGEKEYYTFQLMIDVKGDWDSTYRLLQKNLKKYQKYFGRQGRNTIVVISGNRPPANTFHQYFHLFFDGLPNVSYSQENLKKITMISDNFATYSKWKGVGEISETDKARLAEPINNAHQLGKPFRFWGAPDNEACWKLLHELGADIINTDKVTEATNYFKTNS